MTMMASFLLQPATAKGGVQAPAADQGKASELRPAQTGQDFSRVLQEQRQSMDVKNPAPPPRQQQTARPADSQTDNVRREDRKESQRTSSAKPAGASKKPAANNAGTTETTARQKHDDHVEDTDGLDQVTVEGDSGLDGEEIPGHLDPLLEQIIQAQSELENETTDVLEVLDGADVAGHLLAMIQGGGVSATAGAPASAGKDVTAAQPSGGQTGQPAGILPGHADKTEVELAADESEPLFELDATEESQPLISRLLTAAAAKPARNEPVAGQATRADSVTAAGEVRSDTLLRSEAVQSAQAARQLPAQAPLNMQQPGWNRELVDKVMWLSSQNLKSAEIKLNPAELGRLDIRVQVGQEHTQITFSSAHAGVRDSLDGQMHRLRELLEQQGMSNVDVEVADQSQQEHQHSNEGTSVAGRDGRAGADEVLVAESEVEQQEQGHAGLVSYYV